MAQTGKNTWALFLLLLAGIVLGGFIGYLTRDVPSLSWLNYGKTFGLSKPATLDVGVLAILFGVTVKINIAGIIGMLISAFLYRRL